MKKLWKQIELVVEASPLNNGEKVNVRSKLDSIIGSNFLEDSYPIGIKGLTESEFIVYRDILSALNEGKNYPKIINDSQYEKVVKSIFKRIGTKPTKRIKRKMFEMDEAYTDGDWEKVNIRLKELEGML